MAPNLHLGRARARDRRKFEASVGPGPRPLIGFDGFKYIFKFPKQKKSPHYTAMC